MKKKVLKEKKKTNKQIKKRNTGNKFSINSPEQNKIFNAQNR